MCVNGKNLFTGMKSKCHIIHPWQNQMQALQILLTKQTCKVLQHTREPSEWLCLIDAPPSEAFGFFAASPFGSTILLILVTHSVLSLILSAFSITAL